MTNKQSHEHKHHNGACQRGGGLGEDKEGKYSQLLPGNAIFKKASVAKCILVSATTLHLQVRVVRQDQRKACKHKIPEMAFAITECFKTNVIW